MYCWYFVKKADICPQAENQQLKMKFEGVVLED